MNKQYFVYILASQKHGTLYIGVTNDLEKRSFEHNQEINDSFTKKYGINKLVYYEVSDNISAAIQREKQLKHWKRAWKIELIEESNPDWEDLRELSSSPD